MQTVDLLIRNIGQLATVAGQGPRVGPAASELGIIEGGAVAAIDGRIVAAVVPMNFTADTATTGLPVTRVRIL